MTTATPTAKKLEELYDLIEHLEIALMTTRRANGMLVTRPMATQERIDSADLWFVTDIETHKVEDLQQDPHVCLGYYDDGTKEWVSVSGTAVISQDRSLIRELHQPDWTIWFPHEGGDRDGGPNDPRLALILVDAYSVTYMKSKYSRPRVLFEIAKGFLTGEQPDIGRTETISGTELG